MEIIRSGMVPDMYICGACDSECMGYCYDFIHYCPIECIIF